MALYSRYVEKMLRGQCIGSAKEGVKMGLGRDAVWNIGI